MIYIPTNSPFSESFPLAFRYRNASGREGKITLADASSFDNANLATLKQVIGYALDYPDLNETTLSALDDNLPAIAKFYADCAKQSRNDKDLAKWEKSSRELCKWYAAQRGITLETDVPAATADYPVSKTQEKAVMEINKLLVASLTAGTKPIIRPDGSRSYICNYCVLVAFEKLPAVLAELHPAVMGADDAFTNRDPDEFFPDGLDESAYRDTEKYLPASVGFNFTNFIRMSTDRYPKAVIIPDGDETPDLATLTVCGAKDLRILTDALGDNLRAYIRKSEKFVNRWIFVFGDHAAGLVASHRIDVEEGTLESLAAKRQSLVNFTLPAKKNHVSHTKGETTMPKAKKQTASQEIKPTAVQESKPHIPWTVPDVTAAIGNIMPRLQAVGIVSAHLDDQHRSHVDGHPTPRIKLTNKHGVELPFGDFSCVEKWLAEQEAKQQTAPRHTKITREDIEHAMLRGSGFANGKQRVIEQFAKGESVEKNAAFLKKEYGTGGWSHAFGDDTWLDHDSNGITLTLGDLTKPTDRKLIPWTDAAAIINTLITQGKYIADTPQETKPTAPQPKQEKKPTTAPKKPQEKQTPAESLAASARKAAPKAAVEIKGAQTSCPIVWVYKATAKEADALSALGFVWSNKRQGYWMKPTALSAQESA